MVGELWDPKGIQLQRRRSEESSSLVSTLRKALLAVIIVPMKFRVTIEPDENSMFVAECPALPGCVSQGKTREEAMTNIRDAIQGYLASLKKHDEPIPLGITEEIIEIPV